MPLNKAISAFPDFANSIKLAGEPPKREKPASSPFTGLQTRKANALIYGVGCSWSIRR
jgi:hypothetical protein